MEYRIKLSEFCRYGEPSFSVTEKIVEFFLLPLNSIRNRLGFPIYIRSGYRPKSHELENNRPGTSEHMFEGKGATDVTAVSKNEIAESEETGRKSVRHKQLGLAKLLIDQDFKRIAYYPEDEFFHIDYKGSERVYAISGEDNKWDFCSITEFLKSINR